MAQDRGMGVCLSGVHLSWGTACKDTEAEKSVHWKRSQGSLGLGLGGAGEGWTRRQAVAKSRKALSLLWEGCTEVNGLGWLLYRVRLGMERLTAGV